MLKKASFRYFTQLRKISLDQHETLRKTIFKIWLSRKSKDILHIFCVFIFIFPAAYVNKEISLYLFYFKNTYDIIMFPGFEAVQGTTPVVSRPADSHYTFSACLKC